MPSKRRPLPMLSDGYDLLAMTSEERTRLMSLPTGAMKIVRQNATVVICTECKKPGTLQDTMLCSKACEAGFGKIRQIDTTFQCKIAIYCSKECQKKHWAVHKKLCKVSEIPPTYKLVHTMMSDIWCMAILPQAFITAVGVYKEFTRNNLYIARCDLSIEPDLDIVASLVHRERLVSDFPNGVEGMLQMKLMTVLDPSVAIDSGREKIWKDAKREAFLRSGHFKLPTVNLGPILAVGLVDFHLEGTDQVITLPLPIQEVAVDMARWASDCYIYEDDTFPSGVPLLSQQYCAMLNVHIQDDEKNQTRLRAHVPQESLKKYVGININTYQKVDRPMCAPQCRPNPNATIPEPSKEDKVMQRMHF